MHDLRVAAVQINSTSQRSANLEKAEALVRRAAAEGARFVALPENFAEMAAEGLLIERLEDLQGQVVHWALALSRELGVDLLLGSIPERAPEPERRYNTSVLIDRRRGVVATYRKIHLFDVDLPEQRLMESTVVVPGDRVVVASMEWGRVGLSICYDLRFPELYRRQVLAGAELLAVPAAFTAVTGKEHWEALLRARAIENQAFVIAPAQVGRHSPQRRSWGHAMVVDPWGRVLADAGGETEGVAIADLSAMVLEDLRRRLPCLQHMRLIGGGGEE
ncbi:MAG TPA: carbon-nitrogen hydrolase family protein [Acidobacteria bacterium]|nr:carbon-nitrogen hydrolase family protein [Acidobacteriota bacterium]